MISSFETLINPELCNALKKQNIETPTEIQQKTFSIIMENKDIVASSETGSGKTLAYLLPIFTRLEKDIKNPQAFIILPTHELAVQVYNQAELIVKNSENYGWVEPALIIGGANITRQLEKLKLKPRIIIGSVGRILELIKLKKLTSHFTKTIVIDEADRLLDKRNLEELQVFIKTTLRDRQILLFSASISPNTLETAKIFMKSPEVIDLKTENKLPPLIENIYFLCEYRDKIKVLKQLIHSQKIKKAIVFMNNPSNNLIDNVVEKLNFHGIKASAIYGEVKKHDKRQAISDFRDGRITLLVASDLAARGMDFKDLTHVINFDVPENPEIYLHRAGRCGRMGNTGSCVSLATQHELLFIKKMTKILNIQISEKTMSFGNINEAGLKPIKSKEEKTYVRKR